MKNALFTIAVGADYEKMAELTHPLMRSYADKIGCDFHVVRENTCSSPHWMKFQTVQELLNRYGRIIYFDTDIIVKPDCPDLFKIVPTIKLGLFNELPWTSQRIFSFSEACKDYGLLPKRWKGCYYNTGVMVIPRQFKSLFAKPEKELFNFYEQGYFNAALAMFLERAGNEFSVHDLHYKFNRMTCMDQFTGEHRQASHIIHYAGYPSISFVLDLISKDIKALENPIDYSKKHILIDVQGGLGDQICAQPAIRFMRKHVYPRDNITVKSHWPEIFEGLDVKNFHHSSFVPEPDTPYYHCVSLPGPETIMWKTVSNLLCHTVDFASMALLRRTLPDEDKNFILPTVPDDYFFKSFSILSGVDMKSLVLIHPGRHWDSKTFPIEWWNSLIKTVFAKGRPVCIIGQDEETRGTLPVTIPDGVIDLRNLLNIKELFTIISLAGTLISNDSGPIHIAGAFDNNIILIPTCKHPDHILPWRKGNKYYKAKALYKKLMCFKYDSQPTCIYGSSADKTVGDFFHYLPSVSTVVRSL